MGVIGGWASGAGDLSPMVVVFRLQVVIPHTSIIRNHRPLGLYSRTMHGAIWGSQASGAGDLPRMVVVFRLQVLIPQPLHLVTRVPTPQILAS